MRIRTILEFPGKLPKPFLTFIGFILVLAIGSLDSITSYHVSVSALYLLPIILIAWYEGGVPAAIISIFSAITWALSDLALDTFILISLFPFGMPRWCSEVF